jgi:hypothetical protein
MHSPIAYIERIVKDWSKGEVLAVFANRNMKSASFNANLIDHLSCHDHSYQEELANMTDNRSKNSTLLQSCFVGRPDLTRWILKHTVDDSDKSDIQHGEIDVPSCLDLFMSAPCFTNLSKTLA